MRQVRTDCPGSKAQKGGHLVNIPGLPALQDQGDSRTSLCLYQMLLDTGDCQQGRDGHVVFIHAPVGQDDDIAARRRSAVHGDVELVQRFGQRCIFVVEQGNLSCLKSGLIQMPDL